MSWSIALRRSPNPGALIATALNVPRILLTTSVASASPSTSSAMTTSGLPVLQDLLEQRQELLRAGDLLVHDQQVGVVEDRLLPLGVGDEVRRDVALVELHPLGELELDAEGVRLLDRDDAVLADLVERLGDRGRRSRCRRPRSTRPARSRPSTRRPSTAFLIASTAASTAFSMPRLRAIGLAPAATFFMPPLTIARASTVAVVVPSPATSFVLVATSLVSWAPMFSHGSSSSISLAIVTPSFVIVGAPHFLSSTTFWPLGPSVMATASASLSTPASRPRRASSPNFSSFEANVGLPYLLRATASTSRADRMRYSSPSTLTSVPPYFE